MALLTMEKALAFKARWEAAARYDQLLNVRMPNNKRLRECTPEYIEFIASELGRLTNYNEDNALFSHIG